VDEGGQTALHLAAAQGAAGVARELLKVCADPLLPDGQGRMPLALVSKSVLDPVGSMQTLEVLLVESQPQFTAKELVKAAVATADDNRYKSAGTCAMGSWAQSLSASWTGL
jgi:ankyrin repeat protein